MVVIIVPYVLSFLTDDSEVDNVVDGDDDDDSDGSDWDHIDRDDYLRIRRAMALEEPQR